MLKPVHSMNLEQHQVAADPLCISSFSEDCVK